MMSWTKTPFKTAREIASHSTGTPTWTNDPAFARDVFTFVRVLYARATADSGDLLDRKPLGMVVTDFPDSDLNLSFRLQQVTSMRTDPDGRSASSYGSALSDYPDLYVEPGRLRLRDEEVER